MVELELEYAQASEMREQALAPEFPEQAWTPAYAAQALMRTFAPQGSMPVLELAVTSTRVHGLAVISIRAPAAAYKAGPTSTSRARVSKGEQAHKAELVQTFQQPAAQAPGPMPTSGHPAKAQPISKREQGQISRIPSQHPQVHPLQIRDSGIEIAGI